MKHKPAYRPHIARRKLRRRIALCICIGVLLLLAAFALLRPDLLAALRPAATPTVTPAPQTPPPQTPVSPAPAPAEPDAPLPTAPAASATPAAETFLPDASRPLYELAATLDDDDCMRATLRLRYPNDTGTPLGTLVFRIYPNFESPGAMRINSAAVDGILVQHAINDDGTLLTVPLHAVLAPGESCTVLLELVYDIPRTETRCGKAYHGYQLGNFIPTLAQFENGAWDERDFVAFGDPFHSALADYKVAFSRPSYFASFISTGDIVSEQPGEEGSTITYAAASNVRDFSCIVSGKHNSETVVAECGVAVTSWALSRNNARDTAKMAARAIDVYSEMIGPYPYPTLEVAQASLVGGGMEYPGMIMVDQSLYLDGRSRSLELTIAHEVAHQWFFGAVGSDQLGAPWLDEALVNYLGLLYFDQTDRAEEYETLLAANASEHGGLLWPIDGALGDYPDIDAYQQAVYQRGAFLFYALRETIGVEAFADGLSTYYRENAGRSADKAALISAFSYAAERDLTEWFENWLAPQGAE